MYEEHMILLAPCFFCRERFESNPLTVHSITIDPVTGRPPDVDAEGNPQQPAEEALARARKREVCPACVAEVNAARAERGLPPWPEPPGQLAAEAGW